jgi:hypothetical protein
VLLPSPPPWTRRWSPPREGARFTGAGVAPSERRPAKFPIRLRRRKSRNGAAWDEATAVKLGREPAKPLDWREFFRANPDLTDRQKQQYWEASSKWGRWNSSEERHAAVRLEPAEPLVGAVEAGLLAFFWLSTRGRSWRHTHLCLVVPRPRLLTERSGRGSWRSLHAWDEPAVHWPGGGPAYWYWRGVRIWREIAEHPSRLTARYIVRQQNVERRRILLERLGYERFLADAGATLVQQDDYGKLWRTELRLDDEPVTVVEVTNATQEPDGSYRRYWLRVPPNVRSARHAVAWSFGFERVGEHDCGPDVRER